MIIVSVTLHRDTGPTTSEVQICRNSTDDRLNVTDTTVQTVEKLKTFRDVLSGVMSYYEYTATHIKCWNTKSELVTLWSADDGFISDKTGLDAPFLMEVVRHQGGLMTSQMNFNRTILIVYYRSVRGSH